MGNKNIVEAGIATRFGQPGGMDPTLAANKGMGWRSIRKELRYLAGQKVKGKKPNIIRIIWQRGHSPTIARIIAAMMLQRAIEGEMSAIIFCCNAIDGKPPSVDINGDLAKLRKMTDDELQVELQRLNSETLSLDS